MGYPAGWVTDALDNRNASLRCLGNAVVPQVAEAFCLGLLFNAMGHDWHDAAAVVRDMFPTDALEAAAAKVQEAEG